MKATFYVSDDGPDYLNNNVFTATHFSNGLKNYLFMFADLRQQLAAAGIDLATQDIHPVEESELVIAIDQVAFFQTYARRPGQRLYLIINEPATYFPEVWRRENHTVFDRVFTYDYTLADGHKYIHHYFALDLADYPPFEPVSAAEFEQRKLLVLMAGMLELNKPRAGSPSLLYPRYRTLAWFGRHWPDRFDFFSRGIEDKIYRSFPGLGLLQRVLPASIAGLIADKVASRRRRFVESLNRGPVPANAKLRTIRQYRFAVCYENSRLPGYLSEKIFDCLFAGCVPVYLGEPDVGRFIPEGCLVNREAFSSDAELADFLERMPYAQYQKYMVAIEQFLQSPEIEKFSSAANAQIITSAILKDAGIEGNS
ncbi:glycosyltransferase family 10 domain-containing protein [Hymenobacter monticola]|uniref:Glycosyltransferase family 10 n=1 Tax=Hymenobacter monticola TaxID=1705399 RepID=A0ABY4B580_9BACT|nr:glycosyltransferase family 10 [Hymenobacter monticola]UOE31855.1 glycosyltransferase family 10 [Hymenobacter monticola]